MEVVNELSDSVARLRSLLDQPLAFRVESKSAVLRGAPALEAQVLAKLEPGALVQGIPAGDWLHVDKGEADEWVLPNSELSAPSSGAWIHLEGGDDARDGTLCPQWSAVVMAACQGGTELHWPGIADVGASYIVEWRVLKAEGREAQEGERLVGREPSIVVPGLANVNAFQVRITARLPAGVKLRGAWVSPRLTEADKQHRDTIKRRCRNLCTAESEEKPRNHSVHVEQGTQMISVTIVASKQPVKQVVTLAGRSEKAPQAQKHRGKRIAKHLMSITKNEVYGDLGAVLRSSDSIQKYAKCVRTQKDLECYAALPTTLGCNCLACQRQLPHTPVEPVGQVLKLASQAQESMPPIASETRMTASQSPHATKPAPLDGSWADAAGQLVARIHQDVVTFADGPAARLHAHNRNTISVFLEGVGTITATHDAAGKLVWADGDVWTLVVEASRGTECQNEHTVAACDMPAALSAMRVKQGRSMQNFSIGAGGGGAGDDKGRTSLLEGRAQRGRGNPNLLPPNRFTWTNEQKLEYGNGIQDAKYHCLAQSWLSLWGARSNDPPEELPRARLLITDSNPCIAMIELFSPHTSNMLDAEIQQDVECCQDAFMHYIRRTHVSSNAPRSFVFQGAGPHFCPGGNHHPLSLPGATPFSMCTFKSSRMAMRFNELGVPGVCAIHGAGVGGGPAQGLQCARRSYASNTTISFGNLSRGAVPLMLLSKHITQFGHEAGVRLYLTDDSWSANYMLKMGMVNRIGRNNQENKAFAFDMALSLARGPQNIELLGMRVPIDLGDQYAREAHGFEISGRGGGMFQNAKAKTFDVKEEEGIKVLKQEEGNDNSLLKLDIPVGKTVLEMKERISILWAVAVEDMILMDGDRELLDTDVIPEKAAGGSIKMMLRDQWQGGDWWGAESTEYASQEDYDDDEAWGGADYDDEEWWEEEEGEGWEQDYSHVGHCWSLAMRVRPK